MANETKIDTELESVALRIYVERTANRSPAYAAESVALACFREAEAFLSVRDKVRNKEVATAKEPGPQLADCSAPKLSPTDPINLVSQRYGDPKLKRVREINDWLSKHPTSEDDPAGFIEQVNSNFRELNWRGESLADSLAIVNRARAIFPAYCGN